MQALALGVETHDGLRLFAYMAFDLSPDFHEADPAVKAILRDPGRSEAERFEALYEHLYSNRPPAIGGGA